MKKIIRLSLLLFIPTLHNTLDASFLCSYLCPKTKDSTILSIPSERIARTPILEKSLEIGKNEVWTNSKDKVFEELLNQYPKGFNIADNEGDTVLHKLSLSQYRLENDVKEDNFNKRFHLLYKILERISKEEKSIATCLIQLSKNKKSGFCLPKDIIGMICRFGDFAILYHENKLGQTAIKIAKRNKQYMLWTLLEVMMDRKEKQRHNLATILNDFPNTKMGIKALAKGRREKDFFMSFIAPLKVFPNTPSHFLNRDSFYTVDNIRDLMQETHQTRRGEGLLYENGEFVSSSTLSNET